MSRFVISVVISDIVVVAAKLTSVTYLFVHSGTSVVESFPFKKLIRAVRVNFLSAFGIHSNRSSESAKRTKSLVFSVSLVAKSCGNFVLILYPSSCNNIRFSYSV